MDRHYAPAARHRRPGRTCRSSAWSAAKLKGSIGEGPNHSNFSDQSTVKIVSDFRIFSRNFVSEVRSAENGEEKEKTIKYKDVRNS